MKFMRKIEQIYELSHHGEKLLKLLKMCSKHEQGLFVSLVQRRESLLYIFW